MRERKREGKQANVGKEERYIKKRLRKVENVRMRVRNSETKKR